MRTLQTRTLPLLGLVVLCPVVRDGVRALDSSGLIMTRFSVFQCGAVEPCLDQAAGTESAMEGILLQLIQRSRGLRVSGLFGAGLCLCSCWLKQCAHAFTPPIHDSLLPICGCSSLSLSCSHSFWYTWLLRRCSRTGMWRRLCRCPRLSIFFSSSMAS